MKRIAIGFLIIAGVLLVALAASPVGATPPEEVVIEVETTLPEGEPAYGPFTATGPICPSGDTVDLSAVVGGFQSGNRLQILVHKEFTCDDGSGTFVLLLQVHLQFEPYSDVFTWTVLGGTGAYEKLHGSGDGFGTPTDYGLLDTFTGTMHID